MEAVRQAARELELRSHQVDVATLDAPGEPFVREFPGRVHALGPGRGGYGYTPQWSSWMARHAREYDAIVINGLWQYHSYGAWRALRAARVPYYVYVHGMLDPWFKRTYPLKHMKKWMYWPWADYRVLRDAHAVLFTCEEEKRLASQSFALYRARERVVAFGTSIPPPDGEALRSQFLAANPQLRGRRILLFLGRIHEKKGCDLLIRAFSKIAGVDPTLHLVVAGPDQTGRLPGLLALARDLGVAERTSWPGMLQGDMKWGAFYSAEAFVLPSHQENFGIAVVEALGCGVPVLISDKVNIWREIAAAGAGMVDIDDDPGTLRLLRGWLELSAERRRGMSTRATGIFRQRFTAGAMAESLIEVIGETSKPGRAP
jgi:glycosyltransferase involved in cell wall biosynthesis